MGRIKKILVITTNDPNKSPRPNRLLEHLKTTDYEISLLSYQKFEKYNLNQYHFNKKMNIDLINALLILRLYKIFNQLLLIDSISKADFNSIKKRKFDLIICENIEVTYLAFLLKSENTKLMVDLREYFPRQFDNRFSWSLKKKEYYNLLLKNYVSKFDKIITVSNGLAKAYKDNFDFDCDVYMSLPEKANDKSEIKNEYDAIKIVHHGNATPDRKIENMIYMMDTLDNKYTLDLYLVKMNNAYYDFLLDLSSKYDNVNIHQPVKLEEINSTISKYDIGVYSMEAYSFNIEHTLPNKLFEFIQAGLCLAFGPVPEMKMIIEEYNVGVVSDNFEPSSLAKKIKGMTTQELNKYKNNSRLASDTLNLETNKIKMNGIIEELIN